MWLQDAGGGDALHTFLQSPFMLLQSEASHTGSSGWKLGTSDPGGKPLCSQDIDNFSFCLGIWAQWQLYMSGVLNEWMKNEWINDMDPSNQDFLYLQLTLAQWHQSIIKSVFPDFILQSQLHSWNEWNFHIDVGRRQEKAWKVIAAP